MKKTFYLSAMAVLLLVACGPGKKLQNANSQIVALNTQVASLNTQITTQNSKLSENDQQIKKLQAENQQLSKDAEACNTVKEAIKQRMDNLNKSLEAHGTSMEAIRQKAESALAYLNDAGFKITYQYGLIHINMPDQSMFSSGSTKLNEKGRQAISVVADVLNEYSGIKAIVIGYADTVKVHGKGAIKDNWSLSTERANTIVRLMIRTYKVDPKKLTAAGKSKYSPIADNSTEEGKALNRRTEIILDPEFHRIWELTEPKP